MIALSLQGSIRDAVRCLQAGARDYLWAQPRHGQGLEAALRDALEPLKRTETQQAHTPLKLPALPGFLSLDQQTLSACETAVRAAAMQRPLLICGASGTGKTLLARKVHQLSARCLAPLVEVYCAPTGRAAQEAELFGGGGRQGAVARAEGSTLLLEAAEYLVPRVGLRLARTLQAPGSDADGPTQADVQLIGTADRPEDESGAGCLMRALDGPVRVCLRPLRERRIDIPLLAAHFLGLAAARCRRCIKRITRPAMDALAHYDWPGNARELRNAIEHAVMLTRGGGLQRASLPRRVCAQAASETGSRQVRPLKAALQEPERRHILRALEESGWNKTCAAERLQISRSTLYKKMRRHGLDGEPSEGRPS